MNAAAVAGSTTVTLPAATDTLVGKATTDTLTNKTFDTAGTGNSLSINGLAATANTGTGAVVRATSPAITTPTGIVKGDVGLGNVDNTSDATKNAAVATLTNKTLTAPAVNSPTGIVKADVGLGNVDNTSDVDKPVSTAQAAADALKVNLTRNVSTGCGLAGGGDLSADRTVKSSEAENAQTGTSYTMLATDCGKLVSFSNAAGQSVALDSTLGAGFYVDTVSLGLGTVTMTPSSGTIDGQANLTLSQNDGVRLVLNGANWRSVRGRASGGGGGVPSVFGRTGAVVAVPSDYTPGFIGVPGQNELINGDFRINQRGYASSATLAAGSYGHDRWKAGASGGDYSFTQLASSTAITIASGKSLIQVVEDKNVVGGTYTFGWAGTATCRYGLNTTTPSGSYAASPIAITGQTAGTVMSVECTTGTLGKAKLEAGTSATPFVMRPFATERRDCYRYYVSLTSQVFAVTATHNGSNIKFPEPMRISPTWVSGAFTMISGASGTPVVPIISIDGAYTYNGSGNWTVTAFGTFTGAFDAEL